MAKPGTTIEIVKNDFPMLAGKLDHEAERIVRETVLFIEGQAKSSSPHDTGRLAGSIQSDVTRYDKGWIGVVSTEVEYASYVNYGTGSKGASSPVPERPPEITYTSGWLGMTARPFMSQAGADGRERFENAMKHIL